MHPCSVFEVRGKNSVKVYIIHKSYSTQCSSSHKNEAMSEIDSNDDHSDIFDNLHYQMGGEQSLPNCIDLETLDIWVPHTNAFQLLCQVKD